MFRVKPSKPVAIFGAVVGLGMIIFALSNEGLRENSGFLIFWILAVIGITTINLWSAFSHKGSTYNIERSKDL